MSNFTRTVTKEFNCDGDAVTVVFNRLKTADFQLMATYLETGDDGLPTGKVAFTDQMEMIVKAIEILPKRVESIKGLVDAEGNELSFEDIVHEQYFMELVGEIFAEVMMSSIIADEKKQGKTSAEA